MPPKTSATKLRKAVCRGLLPAAVAVFLLGTAVYPSSAAAEEIDLATVKLRVTPAEGTVAFTGVTGRISLEVPAEEHVSALDIPARFGVLAAEVNDLAAVSLRPVPSSPQGHLSLLTGVFLCAGLGAAITAVGRIQHSDQAC